MSRDEVIAGLAFINAFCKVVNMKCPEKSATIMDLEKCTDEAIKVLNDIHPNCNDE